jgi:type II secretory pathway pseudopilin PulG
MTRLRSHDGFTLMEVLVACTVGFIVLAATLTLLDSSTRLNSGVMSKTDAMQRGRQAMDTITQQLRSQVCLDWNHSAIVPGATADSVTFYDDYTKDGKKPVKRTLTFSTTTGIRSARFDSPSTAVPPPDTSYPTTATSTMNVLENINRQKDPTTGLPVPFLQYYAYPDPATITPGTELQPNVALAPPLNAAQAARVARIDISYLARPTRATNDSKGVNLSDQVMARHADPNLSVPDPNCI